MTYNKFLESAIKYQRKGFSVLPVLPNNKHSYLEHRDKKPLTEQEIKQEWSKCPNAGVAWKTTDIFCIDVDTLEGHGVDGKATFKKEFLARFPVGTFDTLTAQTPSKGLHFYFKKRNGKPDKSKSDILGGSSGIDIQAGANSLSVVPPTVSDVGSYTWLDKTYEIKEAPQELVDYLERLLHPSHTEYKGSYSSNNPNGYSCTTYTGRLLEKLVFSETKGGRNCRLASLAGSLFNTGARPTTVYDFLEFANNHFNPPLPDKELKTVFKSIFKKHMEGR